MKTVYKLYVILVLLAAAGCNNDKSLKADLYNRTKHDINFAAVRYTVQDGEVTLTGTCPSAKTKEKIEQTVKGINIVKAVHNNVQIAPVVLTSMLPVQQQVDSVLANFPQVTADVTENLVMLKGKANQRQASKLLKDMDKLKLPPVENQLVIQ